MDTRYDALNQALWRVNAELKFRGVPPHRVQVDFLSYEKLAGRWQLCANGTPLWRMPLETRLAAVKLIPALFEAIVVAKEQFIPKLDAAIAILQGILYETR